jgi:hypothetical protein
VGARSGRADRTRYYLEAKEGFEHFVRKERGKGESLLFFSEER